MPRKPARHDGSGATAQAERGYSHEVESFLDQHPELAHEMPAIEALISAAFDRPEVIARVHDFAGSDEPTEPVLELVIWCREDRETVRRKRRALLDGSWAELPLDASRHVVFHSYPKAE